MPKFKMGQITTEDLELMAKNLSKPERASAAEKVLVEIRGSGKLQEAIPQPEPRPQTGEGQM